MKVGRNPAKREKAQSANMNISSSKTIIVPLPEGESSHEYIIQNESVCTIVLVSFNQRTVSSRVAVRLASPGSSATILGLVIAKTNAQINLHTMQYHEAPDTTSNLLVKTALWDSATSSVEGGIRVELGAQKTNAYQRNENLLLSRNAKATSKPSLEILADDVRCTHGATMGPISEEELWYLATRGIPKNQAQQLIISGFFQKGIDMLDDEAIRQELFQSVIDAI